MRRRLASPEAETRSYWPPPPPPPPWITLNISLDEPASFRLILQPVCCSNFFAKLGSVYAPHSTTLSAPSPAPTFVGSESDLEMPAVGATSTATTTPSATCQPRMRLLTVPP